MASADYCYYITTTTTTTTTTAPTTITAPTTTTAKKRTFEDDGGDVPEWLLLDESEGLGMMGGKEAEGEGEEEAHTPEWFLSFEIGRFGGVAADSIADAVRCVCVCVCVCVGVGVGVWVCVCSLASCFFFFLLLPIVCF